MEEAITKTLFSNTEERDFLLAATSLQALLRLLSIFKERILKERIS